MIKKLLKTAIVGAMCFTLVSCVGNTKDFTIKSKDFTEEQNEILTLTGNRAFKFDLINQPTDKKYEIDIVYEVYKNKEKIKEETIFGAAYDGTEEKREDTTIAINIQENKIRIMSFGATGAIDIEEDISKLSNYPYNGERTIDIGSEIYLFHAMDGNYFTVAMDKLGEMTQEELDKTLKENETNIFIKLVCKEWEM